MASMARTGSLSAGIRCCRPCCWWCQTLEHHHASANPQTRRGQYRRSGSATVPVALRLARDCPLTLTLLFIFNDAGLIGSFRAEARGAMVGKNMLMLPWEGNWSNYRTQDGMTVPLTGEVAWIKPEGRKPYFLGTVTSLTYAFAS